MRYLILLLIAVMASGCFSGFHSDVQPTQVYVLRASSQAQSSSVPSPHAASIRVARPAAGPGLESAHIVLVQADHRMSYYQSSRWPAALPEVVEALVVDTLRASGSWANVEGSASAFPSDLLLQVAIRRFEADYTTNPNAPEIHVVLDCAIGKRVTREVVTSFVAEGSAVASENRLAQVVTAFEAATNQALGTLASRAAAAADSVRDPERPHKAQNADNPVPSSTR